MYSYIYDSQESYYLNCPFFLNSYAAHISFSINSPYFLVYARCVNLSQCVFYARCINPISPMFVTANNTMCLVMWGKEASAPVHALHFGFGIGAFIAPQLARPFISSQDNHTGEGTTNPTNITEPLGSRIEIPYSISALLTLI